MAPVPPVLNVGGFRLLILLACTSSARERVTGLVLGRQSKDGFVTLMGSLHSQKSVSYYI